MERVTLRIPEQQVDEIDALVDDGRYPNRSEVIRDAVRQFTARVPTRGKL